MKKFLLLGCCMLSLAFVAVAQVPNDECTTATVISSIPYSTSENTRLATPNALDPRISCNDTNGLGKTVWFTYTSPVKQYLHLSTVGSTPADSFDVMLGVFTGSCGSLTQVICNDDSIDGIVRQSALSFQADSGVTYYFLLGEWSGGGTNGGKPTGGSLVFNVTLDKAPIMVLGPKAGSVASGVLVTTDVFTTTLEKPSATFQEREAAENEDIPLVETPKNVTPPSGPEGSNYYEDINPLISKPTGGVTRPVVVKSFGGVPDPRWIPPDPIMAVGPNHVMAAVNTTFRIYDKTGAVLKTIDGDKWFASTGIGNPTNPVTFDPILVYDQIAKRWIFEMLVADNTNKKSYLMLSVSDDDNPIGNWYNYALPADVLGDSVVTNWSDYAHLGFDSLALYITSNQFAYTGTSGTAFSKVRIIDKSKLYANTGGPVTWYDFWAFKDPMNTGTGIFNIKPCNTLSYDGNGFLVNVSPYTMGTFFTVWRVKNPTSNPTITGKNVPVVQYSSAPNSNQLGGGTLIETGGPYIRNVAVYRDSSLWAVHTIASGTGNLNSSVRYVRIDPYAGKTLEDAALGLTGYYHGYPAIMVDKNKNVMITYSRSGDREYIGSYVCGRKATDPPGLSPSVLLKEGVGNYIVVAAGRNRWGDYSGIGLDPVEDSTFWIHSEHAAATNSWGTTVGKIKYAPVSGTLLTLNRSFISYGTKTVGTSSDTISMFLSNDGMDPLVISNIGTLSQHYQILNPPVMPLTIPSLSTVELKIFFAPLKAGTLPDSLVIQSNDPVRPRAVVKLYGTGFAITIAQLGTLYASGGSTDGGKLYALSTLNGAATLIGPSGVTQLTSLRVNPKSKELVGMDNAGTSKGALLYRISGSGNSAEKISEVTVTNLKGLTFKDDSTLYSASFNGNIYTINLKSGVFTQIGTATGLRIGGMAIHPVTGELWFSLRQSGTIDGIYKFNIAAGTAALVGQTGFGEPTVDILFDKNGKLYGLVGIGASINKLITIDQTTGVGSLIGSTGVSNLQAIALNPDAVAGVGSSAKRQIPTAFALEQNYPNPFNPLTMITFAVPTTSFVTVRVFDALGREVETLAEGIRTPGVYQEAFDAGNFASGVYYYKMTAGNFSAVKKMIVVK